MTTSTDQMRAWTGPAVLSFGFRPFFLGGAIWATFAMALWIGMLSDVASLPTRFDPISWHAHEFLFGYLGAIVAGFLLTAVPNWTGRLPIVGWQLFGLFALWLAGRTAIAVSAMLPPVAVAVIDLSMPTALAIAMAREIVAGRNWRNLTILALLLTLIAGNAVFHWEAHDGGYAAGGRGLRIGIGTAIMLIAVIGGRIVPSFTRNWLSKRQETRLPAPTGRFDGFALAVLAIALVSWIAAPFAVTTGLALMAAGITHAVRLIRWAGRKTTTEPLVWVLHVGYALLPLGALVMGLSILTETPMIVPAAQHLWMAGAIGLMTIAVMTRATLGHTGRPLKADAGTMALYGLVLLSALARFVAAMSPSASHSLHMLSGICWIGAFGGFVVLYGPMLSRSRRAG